MAAHVTQKDREQYGEKRKGREGKFPIKDKATAESALRLRGKAKSKEERRSIINRAAKYVPDKAEAARKKDREDGKI
jgi:hypothetical protein